MKKLELNLWQHMRRSRILRRRSETLESAGIRGFVGSVCGGLVVVGCVDTGIFNADVYASGLCLVGTGILVSSGLIVLADHVADNASESQAVVDDYNYPTIAAGTTISDLGS